MEYDQVKDRLEKIIGDSPVARRLFFAALDRLFLRSRYIRREIGRLKRSGFSPEEILDAGSGFGQYSFRLGRMFPAAHITGLDLKQELVNSGNLFVNRSGMNNIEFERGDLLTMDDEGRFDLILCVDVLEHIEEDRKAIGNISRALKPGGIFIFTTPYFEGKSTEEVFVDEHVRPGYSKGETKEKLHEANLELRQFTITYGPWGNIAWKLLQKWPMSWLSGRIWLLPVVFLYYLFAYPIAWIYMHLDMKARNRTGGGILAVAVKR